MIDKINKIKIQDKIYFEIIEKFGLPENPVNDDGENVIIKIDGLSSEDVEDLEIPKGKADFGDSIKKEYNLNHPPKLQSITVNKEEGKETYSIEIVIQKKNEFFPNYKRVVKNIMDREDDEILLINGWGYNRKDCEVEFFYDDQIVDHFPLWGMAIPFALEYFEWVKK